MSVTTRTNRSTNPGLRATVTGYAAVAGTGGTAALAWNSGPGYESDGFGRVTWSVGTTATSGGASLTQTGLSASTAYAMTMWVWSSKATAMRLVIDYRNSSNATVNTVNGLATQVPAGEWVALKATGTSGSAVDRAVITGAVFSTTGATFWNAGDTLDVGATLIETGSTYKDFFDGSSPDGNGQVHSWVGTVNASNSTQVVYVPVLTATPLTTAPCPRIQLTIADLDPSTNVVTVWRTADGRRRAVRGARDWSIVGADTVTDYEAPLGRSTDYSLEISEGLSAGVEVTSVQATVNDTKGWIQDPLDPESAIPVYTDIGPNGEPSLTAEALKRFDYEAGVSLISILGDPEPVALIGQRMAGKNIPFHYFTDQAQQSTNLRNLLSTAAPVLFRPLPEWANALPGACYLAVGTVSELPVNEGWGGQVIEWQMTAALSKAPTINIIVAVTTYGDVQAVRTTYQAAQTLFSGKTYLYAKQNPNG